MLLIARGVPLLRGRRHSPEEKSLAAMAIADAFSLLSREEPTLLDVDATLANWQSITVRMATAALHCKRRLANSLWPSPREPDTCLCGQLVAVCVA